MKTSCDRWISRERITVMSLLPFEPFNEPFWRTAAVAYVHNVHVVKPASRRPVIDSDRNVCSCWRNVWTTVRYHRAKLAQSRKRRTRLNGGEECSTVSNARDVQRACMVETKARSGNVALRPRKRGNMATSTPLICLRYYLYNRFTRPAWISNH
jgi:hypothetical protein